MALSNNEFNSRIGGLLSAHDDEDYTFDIARDAVLDANDNSGFGIRIDRDPKAGHGGVNSGNEAHGADFWNDPKTTQLYSDYVNSLDRDATGRRIENTDSLQYRVLMDHQQERMKPGYDNGKTQFANAMSSGLYRGGLGTADQEADARKAAEERSAERAKREKEQRRLQGIKPLTANQATQLRKDGLNVDPRLIGANLGVSDRIDNLRRELEGQAKDLVTQRSKEEQRRQAEQQSAAQPQKPSPYIHGDEVDQISTNRRGLLNAGNFN